MLRGSRAFALLFLFASGATAQTMMMWPRDLANRWSLQWEVASLVQTFVYLAAAGTIVCVPAFAAGAIVLERERGTFDLLRMTLARPAGVVASKLMNAVGFFFLLTIGLAPVVATAFFLPGFDRTQFLAAFLIIASSAVSCAAVGIMCSAIFRRSLVAIALSYAGVAAIWILPMILLFILVAAYALLFDVRSVGGEIESIFQIVMPVAQLAMVLQVGVGDTFVPAVAYQLVAAFACAYVAHRRLLRPMNPPKIELRKPLDDVKVLRERRTTWPYYLVDPLRRKKPIEDGRNAMLVREVRWGLLNRGSILIRLFYVAATIYFFVGVLASTADARDYQTLWAWFSTQCVLTIIVAPALTANAITKEVELGNLDMLRITLLRPRDIVAGKFAAAVFSLMPLLVAALVSLIPVAILVRPDWRIVALGFGTLGVCTLLSLSIAIFFSTTLRRTLPAIVSSYVASVFAYAGLAYGVQWALGRFLRAQGLDMNFIPALYRPWDADDEFSFLSPLRTLNDSLRHFNAQSPGPSIQFWLIGTGFWATVAALLLAASVWIFARRRMRDP